MPADLFAAARRVIPGGVNSPVRAFRGVGGDPVFIRRAEDQDGRVLFQGDAKPRRAVSESTAFLMATMLADVVDAGTANSAPSTTSARGAR